MSTNPVNNLSAAQLREAADLRDQIEAMEARLHALLSGGASSSPARAASPSPTPAAAPAPAKKKEGRKGKRALSPEALDRIRAGQAKRWAKVRAAQAVAPTAKPERKKPGRKPKAAAPAAPSVKSPKRKMSPEGRARIQAAVKARWARVAAAKAAGAGAPKKKSAAKRGKR